MCLSGLCLLFIHYCFFLFHLFSSAFSILFLFLLRFLARQPNATTYRWFSNTNIESLSVISGPRIRVLGPVLAIEAVTSEDAGTYKCSVSNTGGEASAELRLTITTPLQVDIVPNVLSVHMGGSAEFRCVVTSNGMPIGLQHITWYKDGRQLPSSSRSSDTLLITDVGREDKGMYQCVVRRQDSDSFQASAELQLGGKFHHSVYIFAWHFSFVFHLPTRRLLATTNFRMCADTNR